MSLEEDVRSMLEACLPMLPDDGAKEVRHYLEHGEPAMAFEGCMIELISGGGLPPGVTFSGLAAIAGRLGLDKESVFDGEFWIKFCRWGEQISSNSGPVPG